MSQEEQISLAPPQIARVIFEFDPATGHSGWRTEGAFPLDKLVNLLEVAKVVFVQQQLAQAAQAQALTNGRRVLMPDGSLPPPTS